MSERVSGVSNRPRSADGGEPEFFRRMVAASAERFAYLDRDLRYRAADADYLTSWGLTSEQVIGRRVDEIMDRDFCAREVEARLKAWLAGETVMYEAQLPRRGVRTGWGEVSYLPWRDEVGDVEGVVVCVHDITARRAASNSLNLCAR